MSYIENHHDDEMYEDYLNKMENKETTDKIPTAEEIFHNKLVHYNPKGFPNGMKKAFYKAMQEYALLHLTKQAEVIHRRNPNKQTVFEASEEYKQTIK